MARSEKIAVVKDVWDKIQKSKGVFLFEYHGLNVEDVTGLRRKVRGQNGEIKVVKNTLVKKALADLPLLKDVLSADFKGPIACVFGYKDAVTIAKILVEFTKEDAPLKIRTGVLGHQKLSNLEIKQLAKLPSREILLAQVVGTLAAPLTSLVTVLSAVPRDFIYVLKALEDKKSKA